MFTYESLLSDMQKLVIDPSGTLLIHSSMKAIGGVEGGTDTVLEAWTTYMKDGLLVLPTHTWDRVDAKHPLYDVRATESCVGVLTNQFLKHLGVIRSCHPTHSVAAWGHDAEIFTAGEEYRDSPCPRDGCWGKLYDRNATILFVGCKLNRNTYLHGVEEWNHIPDRISKNTEDLTIIDQFNNTHKIAMHRHHCSFCDDISENYIKMEPVFFHYGAIAYGKFGNADCIVGNARMMADITGEFLQKHDLQLFSNKSPIPKIWYS